eukprot:82016-Heterocapsa_arctica.AAC.1
MRTGHQGRIHLDTIRIQGQPRARYSRISAPPHARSSLAPTKFLSFWSLQTSNRGSTSEDALPPR